MASETQTDQTAVPQPLPAYKVTGLRSALPPVMLVHGFTEDRRIWSRILPALEKKYRFILVDLPGSGDSPANAALKTLGDFAGCLEAVRIAENAEKIVLIGHSMGGYTAMAYAERYPQHLAGLGLFHSTASADSVEKKAAREKNQGFITRHGSAIFVRESLPGLYSQVFRDENPEEIRAQVARYANFDPETLVLYLEAMKIRPDRKELLSRCDVPVLIIVGEEDKVVPPAEGLVLCQLPRISYFHMLPRTAHMGMVENPTLCISCLDRFLDQFTW